MIHRCYNPKCKSYKDYGGRGIVMCDEWKNNFIIFYNWAIDNYWKVGLQIDRINNNGNYEPKNCRWSTPKEQGQNKRNSCLITFKNKTQTISSWSKQLNVDRKTLYNRIYLFNWSIEKAFTQDVNVKHRKKL